MITCYITETLKTIKVSPIYLQKTIHIVHLGQTLFALAVSSKVGCDE